jgi:hypothetical protein
MREGAASPRMIRIFATFRAIKWIMGCVFTQWPASIRVADFGAAKPGRR